MYTVYTVYISKHLCKGKFDKTICVKAHYMSHIDPLSFINTEEADTSFSHTGKLIPFFITLHVKYYRSGVASPAQLLLYYTGVGSRVLTRCGCCYSVLTLVLLPPLISCTITLGDEECIFGEMQQINSCIHGNLITYEREDAENPFNFKRH